MRLEFKRLTQIEPADITALNMALSYFFFCIVSSTLTH